MKVRYRNPEHSKIELIEDSGVKRYFDAVPGNRHYDALIESGTPIEPYVKPPEEARAEAIEQIEADFRAEIAPVTQGYTQEVIDSWGFQVEEARKVKRGEASNALSKLAEGRGKGETPEQVADKILNNRAIFEDVFFTALAKMQRRIDEL